MPSFKNLASPFKNLASPFETELLISFFDLLAFAGTCRRLEDRQIFDFLDGYYKFVTPIVENAGGVIVKFMGDAGLAVFPAESVDEGARAMLAIKEEGDAWIREKGFQMRHVVKMHFGSAVIGPIGPTMPGDGKGIARLDVIGKDVNTAALVQSAGLAMTAQTFRRLSPETRKLFKKHTPPVTYISVNDHHRQ